MYFINTITINLVFSTIIRNTNMDINIILLNLNDILGITIPKHLPSINVPILVLLLHTLDNARSFLILVPHPLSPNKINKQQNITMFILSHKSSKYMFIISWTRNICNILGEYLDRTIIYRSFQNILCH